jgi:hypothetical protein
MNNQHLTLKGEPRKSKAGRKAFFGEETKELRKSVPISQFARLETILDYELEKLKIKK